MPFLGYDTWESQFFSSVTESGVIIPVSDPEAWQQYAKYRWVYNKLDLSKHLGYKAEPFGVYPTIYPVFCKPIINLYGMGMGAFVANKEDDIDERYQPGFFWQPVFDGAHISVDVFVAQGLILGLIGALGDKMSGNRFNMWSIIDVPLQVEKKIEEFVSGCFGDYSGVVNLEFIGNNIIECHVRHSGQFVDLYGEGYLDSLIALYSGDYKNFKLNNPSGYSFAVWGESGKQYEYDQKELENISDQEVSIQLTYSRGECRFNPPGGQRLAIVNSKNYNKGVKIRNDLKNLFKEVQ